MRLCGYAREIQDINWLNGEIIWPDCRCGEPIRSRATRKGANFSEIACPCGRKYEFSVNIIEDLGGKLWASGLSLVQSYEPWIKAELIPFT